MHAHVSAKEVFIVIYEQQKKKREKNCAFGDFYKIRGFGDFYMYIYLTGHSSNAGVLFTTPETQ